MMRNALCDPFPRPVLISYCSLITKWWELLSGRPSLFQCSFLITSLLQNDEMLFWRPSLLQCSCLITSLLQNDEKCSLASFPPPVFISYHILITKWWEMLFWRPSLLQCSFLITSLLQNHEKCFIGSIPSSSVHFLLQPYLKMMRNPFSACRPSSSAHFSYILEAFCSSGQLNYLLVRCVKLPPWLIQSDTR